jgi:hypothetical protein
LRLGLRLLGLFLLLDDEFGDAIGNELLLPLLVRGLEHEDGHAHHERDGNAGQEDLAIAPVVFTVGRPRHDQRPIRDLGGIAVDRKLVAKVLDLFLDLDKLAVQATQVVGLDVDLGEHPIASGLDVCDLLLERGHVLAKLAQLLVHGVGRRLRVQVQIRGARCLELLQRVHDRAEQLALAPLADQFGIEVGESLVEFIEQAADLLDVERVLFQFQ